MKPLPLGPAPVVVRCPNIDTPGAKGFTVYEAGWFYNWGLRPLRMRCLVSEHLAVARCLRGDVDLFMRDEALALCVPRITADREASRT